MCSWDGSCGRLSRHTPPTYAHAPHLGQVGGAWGGCWLCAVGVRGVGLMSHTKGVTLAQRDAFLPFPNVHKGACKDQQWHAGTPLPSRCRLGLADGWQLDKSALGCTFSQLPLQRITRFQELFYLTSALSFPGTVSGF